MNAKDTSTTTQVFCVAQHAGDATANDIKAEMRLALPVLSCALATGATSATSSSSRLGCLSSVGGVAVKQSETHRSAKTYRRRCGCASYSATLVDRLFSVVVSTADSIQAQ